ncbi:MAG: hypothetical protein N3A63_08800 [Bacteroidetes bacterium]|nr:hypothetical protein [Bacteroidota bacterium]
MKNANVLLIPRYEKIDLLLYHQNFEKALLEVEELLQHEPTNFYGKVLKHRLETIILETTTTSTNHTQKKIITALQQLCKMAIARVLKLSVTNRITHMNETLRQRALEEKSNEWLRHARQHFHAHNYEEAYQEVTRALLLNPSNTEALQLKRILTQHITKNQTKTPEYDDPVHISPLPQLADFPTSTVTVHDKILACIEFAEYYRAQGDIETCKKYILEGLSYDQNNEVLRTLKRELDEQEVTA